MRLPRLCGIGLTALALAGSATVTSAAVPVQKVSPIAIGNGNSAGVTVDESGTAHIAWDGNEPTNNNSLHYCTLPRGASSCSVTTTIAAPGNSLERPFVVANGNLIQVLS